MAPSSDILQTHRDSQPSSTNPKRDAGSKSPPQKPTDKSEVHRSCSVAKSCLVTRLWNEFIIWLMTSLNSNSNPRDSPTRVNTRVAPVDTSSSSSCKSRSHTHTHHHRHNPRTPHISLPSSAFTKHHISSDRQNSPAHSHPQSHPQSSTQHHHRPRRSTIMSPENEAKIVRLMMKATGINCRRGLGMRMRTHDSNPNLSESFSESYGYGFYWTCCNSICATARVMGDLGGVMEVAVRGPCNRKNSLANENCGECGHSVCAACKKAAECAEAHH